MIAVGAHHCCAPTRLIKMNIQIRAIEPVPAIGAGHFAVLLVHFMPAFVAQVGMFSPRWFLIPLDGFQEGSIKFVEFICTEPLHFLYDIPGVFL